MDSALRSAIAAANSWPELRNRLRGVDPAGLAARDVRAVQRALAGCPAAPDLRIAFLANHTVEPLPEHLAAAAACAGLRIDSYVGPFGQYVQEVLDPARGLADFAPDLIWLSLDLRALAPRLTGAFLSLSEDERRAEGRRVLDHVGEWVAQARRRTDATLLVANFPRPPEAQAGLADARLGYAEAELYAELNLELLRALRDDPRAFLFDLDQTVARAGSRAACDPKLHFMARMRFGEAPLPALAEELLRFALAMRGHTRKCLVLDLDGTLWGGVVGEEGPLGVRVGVGDPESEAYLEFQRAVRALRDRGILLAICSKNNEADVLEVFEKRPEMPLGLGDFAARRIDWEHKAANLASLADELNLGLDSLVFVDDSPVECARIEELLPEVRTVRLPRDPARYAELLRRSLDFEKLSLTREDAVRAERYAENADREALKRDLHDTRAFLERLATRVSIAPAAEHQIARAHQLFSKTNQFNVTTVRHGLPDVERFVADPRQELLLMEVADAFGPLGIVGLCLVEIEEGGDARIDSFILSCRAMGRGVETALANRVVEQLLLSGRCARLRAEYRPTAKNAPAAGFFEAMGFAVVERGEDGAKRYELRAADAELRETPGIETLKTGEG